MHFGEGDNDLRCFSNSALRQVKLFLAGRGSFIRFMSSSAGIRRYLAGISSDALRCRSRCSRSMLPMVKVTDQLGGVFCVFLLIFSVGTRPKVKRELNGMVAGAYEKGISEG